MSMIWVGYRRSSDEARTLLEDPELFEELLESDDGVTSVDLDKAWHGLHWLLTGADGPTAHPASLAIFGGEPIGEDLGYGPSRLLSAAQVGALAAELARVDVETLRSRVDRTSMEEAGIYPAIWDEDDVFDTYLAPAYADLRGFYAAAADAGEAVIQTLC